MYLGRDGGGTPQISTQTDGGHDGHQLGRYPGGYPHPDIPTSGRGDLELEAFMAALLVGDQRGKCLDCHCYVASSNCLICVAVSTYNACDIMLVFASKDIAQRRP